MRKILLSFFLGLSIFSLSSCTTTTNQGQNQIPSEIPSVGENKEVKANIKDDIIYDFKIEVEDIIYTISEYSDKPVIIGLFKCTNNSDRVDSFRGQFEDQVTVNGVALERATLYASQEKAEFDKYNLSEPTVQLLPGDSIYLTRSWYITDDIPLNSTFALMVHPYFNNDDYVVKKFTFDNDKKVIFKD